MKGAAGSGRFSRKEHSPEEFSSSVAQMPKRPDSYRMITFCSIADGNAGVAIITVGGKRRRLNGGTAGHKSWEKHAWQNCHGPTLLSENMYHLPPLPLSHIPPPAWRLAPVCSPLPLFVPASSYFFEYCRKNLTRVMLTQDPQKFHGIEFPKQRTESRDSFSNCLLGPPLFPLFVCRGPFGSGSSMRSMGRNVEGIAKGIEGNRCIRNEGTIARAPKCTFDSLGLLKYK